MEKFSSSKEKLMDRSVLNYRQESLFSGAHFCLPENSSKQYRSTTYVSF